ncbi:MAG: DAK2 domain-containing protein [Chloroflexi bacterium]|nr:MAG: DAK2 domain-containing protein [Chloroflexota bacterium]
MKTRPVAEQKPQARPRLVDGQLFKLALLGSLSWLTANQEEVNRLNVFPVPDGDTGTNMLLTLQSAVEDIRESDAKEISKIAALAAHGSLMGARGNSGVILSQIFRGFAKHVQGKAELTPAELADAFEEAGARRPRPRPRTRTRASTLSCAPPRARPRPRPTTRLPSSPSCTRPASSTRAGSASR